MLHTTVKVEFPHVGSIAWRRGTAEPARILRANADGTLLLERRRKLADGTTAPLPSGAASGNITVPLADVFPDEWTAIHGSIRKAQAARRKLSPSYSSPRT